MTLLLLAAPLLALGQAAGAADLAAPFRVEAGGAPIDVDVGHAAPLFVDWDGDGLRDLLVGQFGEGKLRIYRNAGTRAAPRFDELAWFRTVVELGTVPTG